MTDGFEEDEDSYTVRVVTSRVFFCLFGRLHIPTPFYVVRGTIDGDTFFEKLSLFAYRARRQEHEATILAQARVAVWIAEQFLVEDLDN